MTLSPELLNRLRGLIGRDIEYRGQRCCVIEILPHENALVVQCTGRQRVIQPNQYGEASRLVPGHHTLPVFDDEGRLHSLIAGWLEAVQ